MAKQTDVDLLVFNGSGGGMMQVENNITGTLRKETRGHEPVVFHPTQDPIHSADGTTHSMGCGSSTGQASIAIAMHETGQGFWQEGDVSGTIRAEGENRPSRPSNVVAFAQNQLGEVRTGEVTNTLNQNSNASGRNTPMVAVGAFSAGNSKDSRSIGYSENHTPPLRSGASGTNQVPTIHSHSMQVRRLTPKECERLQGFPDDHTLIPVKKISKVRYLADVAKGKDSREFGNGQYFRMAADGVRYKALGNSMAVNVMSWIGQRIDMVDKLTHPRQPGTKGEVRL
jgi:DNA (cytosine-5)-methyltransferase 1